MTDNEKSPPSGTLLQFPGPAPDDKERATAARTAARMLLALANEIEARAQPKKGGREGKEQ